VIVCLLLACFSYLLVVYLLPTMPRSKANHLKEMQVLRDLSAGVVTPADAMAMAPTVPLASAPWSSGSAEGVALRKALIDREIPMDISTKQLLSLYPEYVKYKRTSLANGLRTMKREISLVNGSNVDFSEGEFQAAFTFLVFCSTHPLLSFSLTISGFLLLRFFVSL
jgi:hypothetical protein